MNATIDGTLCQPLLGETQPPVGGGPHLQTGWYTLLIPPEPPQVTNCNDGGGGSADCHDNTIYFSCCARLSKRHRKTVPVDIHLATLPSGSGSLLRAVDNLHRRTEGRERQSMCWGRHGAARLENPWGDAANSINYRTRQSPRCLIRSTIPQERWASHSLADPDTTGLYLVLAKL
jgi:hypothetical protein